MTRYFFNLSFANRRLNDDDGVELAGLEAARAEGLAVVAELLARRHENTGRWRGWRLHIVDAAGAEAILLPIAASTLEAAGGVPPIAGTRAGNATVRVAFTATLSDRGRLLVAEIELRTQRTRELIAEGEGLRRALSHVIAVARETIQHAREAVDRSTNSNA